MNLGKKYKQLFEGKTRSNDSNLLNESNVKVTSHDEIHDDTIEFEGTINGKPWRAEKEYLRDGAVFTNVFDENEENMEEYNPDAYDDIITAINDYMEKERIVGPEDY